MKSYIGLGSNLGHKKENLEKAAHALVRLSKNEKLKVSPYYTTPALVPNGAPLDWNIPYLNAVAEIEWDGSAGDLLKELKKIEMNLGRVEAPRWAPRLIDLDLLLFGHDILFEENLKVPHPRLFERSFVLDPLKDLAPTFTLVGDSQPLVQRARKLRTHSPWLMAILNLTPDSFSDGGALADFSEVELKIKKIEEYGVQAIDIGAESTRPGATPLKAEEEWDRLEPVLLYLNKRYQGKWIRPYVSVDTRTPWVAQKALALGVDCINDVSGMSHPEMLEVIKQSKCDFVFMHSLSVPANPRVTFSMNEDPVHELKKFIAFKRKEFESQNIDLNRAIFDPGIGFGKTAQQSITLLKRMEEFSDCPFRILVGHSRKSFLKSFDFFEDPTKRDAATLALSLELSRRGVDLLRIHDFENHATAFRMLSEIL